MTHELGTTARRVAASVAVAAGLTVVVYAALRTTERLLLPQANPAIVIWSERSTFLWRSGVAAWLGGLGLFAGWVVGRDDPERALRLAALLGAPGLVWLVLQAMVAP